MNAMNERTEYIEGLREVAAWLEAHPEIPLPGVENELSIFALDSKEDAAKLIRALGTCEKSYDDMMFKVSKKFRGVTLKGIFYRDAVCEKRVTGYREIPEHVVPARQEEIVEWDCNSVLAPVAAVTPEQQ